MKEEKEWAFKKQREQLISMIKNALEKKVSPNMAMDLVDACILAVFEYKENLTKHNSSSKKDCFIVALPKETYKMMLRRNDEIADFVISSPS